MDKACSALCSSDDTQTSETCRGSIAFFVILLLRGDDNEICLICLSEQTRTWLTFQEMQVVAERVAHKMLVKSDWCMMLDVFGAGLPGRQTGNLMLAVADFSVF